MRVCVCVCVSVCLCVLALPLGPGLTEHGQKAPHALILSPEAQMRGWRCSLTEPKPRSPTCSPAFLVN